MADSQLNTGLYSALHYFLICMYLCIALSTRNKKIVLYFDSTFYKYLVQTRQVICCIEIESEQERWHCSVETWIHLSYLGKKAHSGNDSFFARLDTVLAWKAAHCFWEENSVKMNIFDPALGWEERFWNSSFYCSNLLSPFGLVFQVMRVNFQSLHSIRKLMPDNINQQS